MNWYEKEDWDRIVYTIDYEREGYPIIEHRLGDIVWDYAEDGGGGQDRMFVEENELYRRENLFPWRELVQTFDTEAEAKHALLLCHRADMYENRGSNGNSWVYEKREDAEEAQREDLEEDDEPAAPAPAA